MKFYSYVKGGQKKFGHAEGRGKKGFGVVFTFVVFKF